MATTALVVLGLVAAGLVATPGRALAATDTNILELPAEDRPVLPAADGPLRYVALGDSFSSGEGAPVDIREEGGWGRLFRDRQFKAFYGDPADDGYACHRSPSAYPVGVAAALGPGWGLDLRACSGAKFADLDRPQNGEPPQIAGVSAPADLITMTMGGNDLAFATIVRECVAEAAAYSVVGADCRTRENTFRNGLGELRRKLADRYGQLQRTLRPGGRLVLLGYPRMFPSDPPGSCGAGVGGNIRRENMRWLNTVSERVSNTIRAAATDTGATYVDTVDLLSTAPGTSEQDRHDGCLDDDRRRWVNRLVAPNAFEGIGALNWSWHPKAGAHARMASLVTACVRDPLTCDSPERRAAASPQVEAPPEPCLVNCPDLTVSDRWTTLRPGPLTSDGPGITDALFRALRLPECEAARGGPGAGTKIDEVATGDLTGDVWHEAAVVVSCVPATSRWAEHVVVLDGEGGPRTATRLDPEITNGDLVGTTSRPATTLEGLKPSIQDGVLTVDGSARSMLVTTAAAPDFAYRQEFRRSGGRWTVGPVDLRPR